MQKPRDTEHGPQPHDQVASVAPTMLNAQPRLLSGNRAMAQMLSANITSARPTCVAVKPKVKTSTCAGENNSHEMTGSASSRCQRGAPTVKAEVNRPTFTTDNPMANRSVARMLQCVSAAMAAVTSTGSANEWQPPRNVARK